MPRRRDKPAWSDHKSMGPQPRPWSQIKEKFKHAALDVNGDPIVYDDGGRSFFTLDTVRAVCKVHGQYIKTVKGHISKGCPGCGSTRALAAARKSKPRVVVDLSSILSRLSDRKTTSVTPPDTSVYMATKLTVRCAEHGVSRVSPKQLTTSTHACRRCNQDAARPTVSDFLKACAFWRGDYDTEATKVTHVNGARITSNTRVSVLDDLTVRCTEHGDFTRNAGTYKKLTHPCPMCARALTNKSRRESFADKLAAVSALHPKLDLSFVKEHAKDGSLAVFWDVACMNHDIPVRYRTRYSNLRVHGIRGCHACDVTTVPVPELRYLTHSGVCRSKPELAVLQALDTEDMDGVHVALGRRVSGAPWTVDLLFPELRVAIEINGLYWHNADTSASGVNKHRVKAAALQRTGIQLLQFTDSQVRTRLPLVRSMIRAKLGLFDRRGYARDFRTTTISAAVARTFLDANHLSGFQHGSTYVALTTSKGTPVVVAVFGLPRFDRSADLELIRFATKQNAQVVGGLSRLTKYACSLTGATRVVSYANNLWSNYAAAYLSAGYSYSHITRPGYEWHNRLGHVLTRYQTQKHRLSVLLGESFDPRKSEYENLSGCGYVRIHDAGHTVYYYEAPRRANH